MNFILVWGNYDKTNICFDQTVFLSHFTAAE